MEPGANLFTLLDHLVDGWCERRALRPLSIILRAYPMTSPLTDGWYDLRDALRDLRAARDAGISDTEAAEIEDALRAVEQALRRR
jgi:hypothetical protein